MIRGIILGLLSLFSMSSFSCVDAKPTEDANFCNSFKSVAICYCSSSLPRGMCQDMNILYARMVSLYGSLDGACGSQTYTSKQNCIDNWNCYRLGGQNSAGRLCSGTGSPCK